MVTEVPSEKYEKQTKPESDANDTPNYRHASRTAGIVDAFYCEQVGTSFYVESRGQFRIGDGSPTIGARCAYCPGCGERIN